MNLPENSVFDLNGYVFVCNENDIDHVLYRVCVFTACPVPLTQEMAGPMAQHKTKLVQPVKPPTSDRPEKSSRHC